MSNPPVDQQDFAQEVTSRFGLMPSFFLSAEEAPEMVERLWDFAKAAYLDNPIPSLFKERLFVYLSRFCEVRYCITRHCAFLLGYGHAAGDRQVRKQTIDEVIALLKMVPPWQRDAEETFKPLEALSAPIGWPEPGTPAEYSLFSAATIIFVQPTRSERARQSLRRAVGGKQFEYFMGLLTFVRAAHYWTILHPELELEDDILEMLRCNDDLRRILFEDPEASRCDMGTRLFSELESLRELHERRDLEKANRELQRRAEENELLLEEKELLLKEVNHRVKNSLQIVSSVLHLQLPLVKDPLAADALRSTEARVMAIAAVHERLYQDSDIRSMKIDSFLSELCNEIAFAYGASSGIVVEAHPIIVTTDQAIAIALIVNELVTNAFKHVGPPCQVTLRDEGETGFKLTVSDAGKGPSKGETHKGLGTRIVAALLQQLNATLETKTDAQGYRCELLIPNRPRNCSP
jgi:two-component sensor histidine kinase